MVEWLGDAVVARREVQANWRFVHVQPATDTMTGTVFELKASLPKATLHQGEHFLHNEKKILDEKYLSFSD